VTDIFSFFEKPRGELDRFASAVRLARAAGLSLRRGSRGLSIGFAAPVANPDWSHGQVKSGAMWDEQRKPARGGLACAKIFGPVQDYACTCGKYKRMKDRGMICEKCGVEVIGSRVRRERMAHVVLETPIAPQGSAEPWPVVPILPPEGRPADLDEAYARLFDGTDRKRALDAIVERTLALLVEALAPTTRRNMDFSGMAVAFVGTRRRVPLRMLAQMVSPMAMGLLETLGYVSTIKSAKKVLDTNPELTREMVRMVMHDRVLIFGGRNDVLVGASVEIGDEPVIELDPVTAARIDVVTGSLVNVYFPITDAGQAEAKNLVEGSTPLGSSGARSWVTDVADASDPVRVLVRHAAEDALDPCVSPMAALLVGGYELTGPPARRPEFGPPPPPPPKPETSPHLERSIDDLELSVRTANALQNARIKTIGELVQRTESDLLKSNGFGRQSLKEVKEILAELGLTLGMRP
jgi:uncharacterized protein YneF (UPF0154 family)